MIWCEIIKLHCANEMIVFLIYILIYVLFVFSISNVEIYGCGTMLLFYTSF